MLPCLFVSDLHGKPDRYEKLLRAIERELPRAVLLGGDLLPHLMAAWSPSNLDTPDFVYGFLGEKFGSLRERLGERYPMILLILGNDDPRSEEAALLDLASEGLWTYLHGRSKKLGDYRFYGYSYVPPTPFRLKDWEQYDVSRYVDPGCVSPEEGVRTMPVSDRKKRYSNMKEDIDNLVGSDDLDKAVFLFHAPPYKSALDRAALDGKMVDYVPIDVHTGSIAIQRFVEDRQPLLSLHGHIHESARLTGSWRDKIGKTHMFSAAHDGPELSLVRFDLENLEGATRELI